MVRAPIAAHARAGMRPERVKPLSGAERQARFEERHGPPIKAHVPAEIREALQTHARLRGLRMADLVRDALRRYLEQNQVKVQQLPERPREPQA
jgi:hypothetical protein